jgi:hypothetical protein
VIVICSTNVDGRRGGHLPGDIVIDRQGVKFFFPVTTMLIVSAVLSIIAWLMRR